MSGGLSLNFFWWSQLATEGICRERVRSQKEQSLKGGEALQHAGRKCHNERSNKEEDAIQAYSQAPAIVQHESATNESPKDSPKLGSPDHDLC